MKSLAGAVAIIAVAYSAFADSEPARWAETSAGKVWVETTRGMTLYTSDKDQVGSSSCYAQCVETWPPLTVLAGQKAVGDWTIIDRHDGARQWAYNGKPLYLSVKDKKPGEANGDRQDGFHVVK